MFRPHARAVLILCFAANAAVQAIAQGVHIGMDRTEVHRLLGTPVRLHSSEIGMSAETLIERRAMERTLDREQIADVYLRRTKYNLYQIAILYTIDNTASRLYPRLRADRILFTLDKPATIGRFIVDIPEIAKLCGSGCSVQPELNSLSDWPHVELRPLVAPEFTRALMEVFHRRHPEDAKEEARAFFSWDNHDPVAEDWRKQVIDNARMLVVPIQEKEDPNVEVWRPATMKR